MKRTIVVFAVLVVAMVAGQAAAKDINFTTGLLQGQFKDLSKEAGAALAYHNVAPAGPLGITGFDAGVEVSAISIKKESAQWKSAFNQDAPDYLLIPRLRVRKGLPLGIDLGAMYAYVPDSNVKLFGFEVGKSILDGTAATPALGVRATYTRLTGVADLGLQTAGVDATISKGFVIVTPYVGGGMLWIDNRPKGAVIGALKEEKIWLPRGFAGLKISPFPFFAVTAEAEYAVRPIFSLKAAINF